MYLRPKTFRHENYEENILNTYDFSKNFIQHISSNIWLIGLYTSTYNRDDDDTFHDDINNSMDKGQYYRHRLSGVGSAYYDDDCTPFFVAIKDSKYSTMDSEYYSNIGMVLVRGVVLGSTK